MDGLYFQTTTKTTLIGELGNQYFAGTGIELRINATLFYHLPVRINLGLYYGLTEDASGGFQPFVGLAF